MPLLGLISAGINGMGNCTPYHQKRMVVPMPRSRSRFTFVSGLDEVAFYSCLFTESDTVMIDLASS